MKNHLNFKIICAFICSFVLMSNTFALDIYLAPNGNDSNNGSSLAQAVATIDRAVKLVNLQSDMTPARILVSPGVYRGQSVVIDEVAKNRMEIIGQSKDVANFPVFVGNGSEQTWLTLKSSSGKKTGLTIQALEIRDYFTAISLEGNRDNFQEDNSGTTIRRNVFRNIGSVSTNGENWSSAAVRFVNSKNNLVEFNIFQKIRNKKDCGGLHSLYLAHFSSGNKIANNIFDDTCGAVIKLRDRSNGNFIENNKFKHIENSPVVEEWFCDKNARKDCTKKLGECPSTENVQKNNTLTDSDNSQLISVVGNHDRRAWCSSEDFILDRVLTR